MVARFPAGNGDSLRHAGRRLFEGDGKDHLQVAAAGRGVGARTGTAEAAEHAAEKVAEDVLGPGAGKGIAGVVGGAEAVVTLSFFLIAEDGKSLVDLLVFLFRFGIVRMSVGVAVADFQAKGPLDLDGRRVAGDAKNFVVVPMRSSHCLRPIIR